MKNSETISTTKKIWTSNLNEKEHKDEIKLFLKVFQKRKEKASVPNEKQVSKEK